MIPGDQAVDIFQRLGVSHVVWIPDSEVGVWDAALSGASTLRLVRATREGEAIAIAGGLYLGGARPLVIIQCTGFFEAGDSLRNFVHDLTLPLAFLIGLRNYTAHKAGHSSDSWSGRLCEPATPAIAARFLRSQSCRPGVCHFKFSKRLFRRSNCTTR